MKTKVAEIIKIIQSGQSDQIRCDQLSDYHENDIAKVLEYLTTEERKSLYGLLGVEKTSDIFTYIDDVAMYIEELNIRQAAHIIENMDADEALDILDEMNHDMRAALIQQVNQETKEDIALIQSYDDEEIGSQMTTNYIEINKNLSVKQAMKALVSQAQDNDNISTLYVRDDKGHFYGAIDLKDLIIAREYVELEDLISTSYPTVRAHERIDDCLERLKDYAEDSIPVLDDQNHLIGAITSQDIVEVVDDEMGDDYAKLAGLTAEEDLKETLVQSMRKRMPWLIILLVLGIGVSTVVGLFEGVLSQIALLVCFQSLILDMAGNVGTQSLAVTIRVLMDENLLAGQKIQLIFKEVRVGFSNGLLLGALSFLVIGLYIYFVKSKTMVYSFAISGCVGAALMLAMVISSFVGTTIPMFFHKIKVDPAVASGPLITTVNDLVAVVTYYGLAWILLINVMQMV